MYEYKGDQVTPGDIQVYADKYEMGYDQALTHLLANGMKSSGSAEDFFLGDDDKALEFFSQEDEQGVEKLREQYKGQGFEFEEMSLTFFRNTPGMSGVRVIAPNKEVLELEFNVDNFAHNPKAIELKIKENNIALEGMQPGGAKDLYIKENEKLKAKLNTDANFVPDQRNKLLEFMSANAPADAQKISDENRYKRQAIHADFQEATSLDELDLFEINNTYTDISVFDKQEAPWYKRAAAKVADLGLAGVILSAPVQPHQAELDEAAREFRNSNDPEIKKLADNQKAVKERALEILKENANQEARNQKAKIILEGLEKGEMPAFVTENFSNLDPESVKGMLTVGSAEFIQDFALTSELLLNKEQEIIDIDSKLKNISSNIEDPNYSFEIAEGEETVTLVNGKVLPLSVYDEYTDGIKLQNVELKNLENLYEKKNEYAGDVKNTALQMDLLQKNYNDVGKFLTNTGLAFTDYFTKIGDLSHAMSPEMEEIRTKQAKLFMESTQRARATYKDDVKFEDAFKDGDNFIEFFAHTLVANQLPIIASFAVAGPYGGSAIIGKSSFSEQYMDMSMKDYANRDLAADLGQPYEMQSKLYKAGVSAAYALPEVVLDRLTTGARVTGLKAMLSSSRRSVQNKETLAKYIMKSSLNTGIDTVAGGVSEGSTQIIQNIVTGKTLTDGLSEAFVSGLLLDGALSSLPAVKGLVLNQLSDYDTYAGVRELQGSIDALIQSYNNTAYNIQNSKEQVPSYILDEQQRTKDQINELIKERDTEIAAIEAKVMGLNDEVGLSVEDSKIFSSARAKQESLRQRYSDIKNDNNISKKEKKKLLANIDLEFRGLEMGIQSFLKSNFENKRQWELLALNDPKTVNEWKEKARQKLSTNGVDSQEESINEEARVLYNTDLIEKNLSRARRNGKLDRSLTAVRNEDDLNNLITKLEEEGIKKKDIDLLREGYKSGSVNGFNLSGVTKKGGSVIFIENMASNNRTEVRGHELFHELGAQAFKNDPNVYAGMATSILEWAKRNDKPLYNRLLNITETESGIGRDQGKYKSDEVIAVFFEEVAANRVDLKAGKNRVLLALAGTSFAKTMKEKYNIDFDLAGVDDTMELIVGLAKKVDVGSLTMKDLKALSTNEQILALAERGKKTYKNFADQKGQEVKKSYQKTDRDKRLDAIGEKYTKEEWNNGGSDTAISDMYMSGDLEAIVRNNLSSELKNLPNYSEEDFISETIGELMPHISNFNPLRKEDKNGKKNPVYEYLIKAGIKESDISSLSLGQAKKQLSDYASKETTSEADKININKTIEKYGLSGWIRGQVSNKIGEVLKKKKATTETFTVDTTDEKVKETIESADDLQDLQEEDLSIGAQSKRKAKAERREEKGMEEGVEYSTFRRALKINGEQGLSDKKVDQVKQAVMKTMATERTTPDSEKFIANIKKSFLTELKKPIQDMMGGKEVFISFLKTNREAIIAALPTSTLVQMERNVDPADRVFTVEVKRNLNPTETDQAIANDQLPKDTNRKSGPTLYAKRMPSEGEFLRYFNPPLYVPSKKDPNKSVRSGLKGTRKDTLAEQMGVELAFDATMEVVQSPEVAERRSLVTNTDFLETGVEQLAKSIGRGVDIKFSISNPAEIGFKMDLALDNVNTDAYLDIRFSKSSRDAYIKRLVKNRPDLKGKEEQYVDSVFDWLETTDIKKRSKYEKMAMHYMAKGYLILPEDGYKVIEAERLATIKKIDPFYVGNPNEIIEKYAGTVKGVRTNPDTVKEFSNKKDLGNGVVTYDVEQTKEGQIAVRKVIDTHFGKKSNPWCLAARSDRAEQEFQEFSDKDEADRYVDDLKGRGYKTEVFQTESEGTYEVYGDLMFKPGDNRELDDAYRMWKKYQEGGKGYQIVFTDGKLSHFRDGIGTYWDRLDDSSDYIGKKLSDIKLEDGFTQERELNVNTGEEVLGKRTKTTGNQQDGTYTNITIENDEVGDGKVEQVTGFNEVYDRVDDLEDSGYEVSDPEVVQEGDSNTTVYEIQYFDPRATLKTDYKAVELKEVREDGELTYQKKLTKYPGESYGTETKYSGDSKTVTNTQSHPEGLKKDGSPRWELETTLERAGKVAGVNLKLDKYTETTFVNDYKQHNKTLLLNGIYDRIGSKHTVKGELNGKDTTIEIVDSVDVNKDTNITKVKVNGKTVYTAPKVDDTGIKFASNKKKLYQFFNKIKRGGVLEMDFNDINQVEAFLYYAQRPEEDYNDVNLFTDVKKVLNEKLFYADTGKPIQNPIKLEIVTLNNFINATSPKGNQDILIERLKEIAEIYQKEGKTDKAREQISKLKTLDFPYKEGAVQVALKGVSSGVLPDNAITAFEEVFGHENKADSFRTPARTFFLVKNKTNNNFKVLINKEENLESQAPKKLNDLRRKMQEEIKAKDQINIIESIIGRDYGGTTDKLTAREANILKNDPRWNALAVKVRVTTSFAAADYLKAGKKKPIASSYITVGNMGTMTMGNADQLALGGIIPKFEGRPMDLVMRQILESNSKGTEYSIKFKVEGQMRANDKKKSGEKVFQKSPINFYVQEDVNRVVSELEARRGVIKDPTSYRDATPEEIRQLTNLKLSKSKDKKAPTIKQVIAGNTLNKMIQRSKGIDFEEIISGAAARRLGKNKNPFQFFVPPSADDLSGLLYYLAGKGKQGDADLKFLKEFLLDPLGKGERSLATKKQQVMTDYGALNKANPEAKKKLSKLIPDSKYTYDTAVRVFLWNQDGVEIKDISNKEVGELVSIVRNDAELQEYAQGLLAVVANIEGKYPEPVQDWIVGNTAHDAYLSTTKVGRKFFLAEFLENAEAMFTKDNMNKLTAAYGVEYTNALKDILHRIKTGENRPLASETDKNTNNFMKWTTNSTGAIMFFNTKSALLQTLSSVNYLNWSDNNPLQAGKAFADQKQFWSDFSMLFNSDMLKQRRSGLATDVQAAEIASAAAGAKNKASAVLAYMLKKGFLPTQIADSFAISAGGAAFYRNRVNSYLKQGMDKKSAEQKAFADFADITEENQQSSRPDRVSQQQASPLGRLVLAFQNTPMQYNRIIKKSMMDLQAGRGDTKTHVSKIIYYAGVQAFIFAALQNALFAMLFEEDEQQDQTSAELDKKRDKEQLKYTRIVNSMIDGLLNGSGVKGRVISTVKNTILKFIEEDKKEWNANYTKLAVEAANISPPIGAKLRKISKAGENYGWNKKAIKEIGYDNYFNPVYVTAATFVEAATNVPLARVVRKLDNLVEVANQNNAAWQRIGALMGWSQWDLGIEGKRRETVNEAKETIKERKEDKKKQAKKDKKAKEKRCSAIKSNGKRCKNMTSNKSGRCYAHN